MTDAAIKLLARAMIELADQAAYGGRESPMRVDFARPEIDSGDAAGATLAIKMVENTGARALGKAGGEACCSGTVPLQCSGSGEL